MFLHQGWDSMNPNGRGQDFNWRQVAHSSIRIIVWSEGIVPHSSRLYRDEWAPPKQVREQRRCARLFIPWAPLQKISRRRRTIGIGKNSIANPCGTSRYQPSSQYQECPGHSPSILRYQKINTIPPHPLGVHFGHSHPPQRKSPTLADEAFAFRGRRERSAWTACPELVEGASPSRSSRDLGA